MAHYPEMEDDEEELEATRSKPRRRSGPRFGPLLTIAVAILTLFGAASRLGKPQSGDGLFSIDLSATKKLEQDRLRAEENRLRTIITIGAEPVASGALRPSNRGLALDPNPLPPSRGEFDIDAYRRGSVMGDHTEDRRPIPMQSVLPLPGGDIGDNYDRSARFDPAPEAIPGGAPNPKTYTVQAGDTWVKVAQKTGKRWQDLQKANPASSSGLRVGMKLVVP